MSFLLNCPNCGTREVTDFAFGGELASRPDGHPSWRELNAYNYFRKNVAGVQREWWFHRSGCRAWFIAERDTRTNEVLMTGHFEQVDSGAEPATSAPGSTAGGAIPATTSGTAPLT